MSDTATQVSELLNAPPAPETTSPTPEAPQAPATPATPATPEFLKVNDRTVYKSSEDAIKGFTELQGRVTSLSQWEQLIAAPVEKGGFGLSDPKQVAALLDELAEIRTKNAASQQATPAGGTRTDSSTVQRAAGGDKNAYDSLTPEWKAHVDELKRLGYVTQDALKPLQDQLQSLTADQQAAHQAQIDNAVSHGTTILEKVMKDTGVSVTSELLEAVGKSVGGQIDKDSYDASGRIIPGSLADQFLRGNEADRTRIISDQFDLFKRFGDAFAASKTASYVQAKTTAQQNNPRTLPAGSPPASTERTGRMTDDQRKKALLNELGNAGFK